MKTKVENLQGCLRLLNIEVSQAELGQQFDRVYADICKVARVPGYRPGHVPRDLLELHYGKRAKEEVIKRAIPEYYLKAVQSEQLAPVAHPEIENVEFKDYKLCFSARVDVKPEVKIKAYKNLKVMKKKITIESHQIDEVLESLRQSKAKDAAKEANNVQEKTSPVRNKTPQASVAPSAEISNGVKPELNDDFAKNLGFTTLPELKEAIRKNLYANAELETKTDMQRQILAELLKRVSLDAPQSMVNRQTQELLTQLKTNHTLQGGKKEELEYKVKQGQVQAQEEALRRVKVFFILEEIAQRENIQANEEDLNKRIEEIAQRSGKSKDEIKHYLEQQNLIPGLKAEIKEIKIIEFLTKEAKVEEQ